ncbi:NAD-dependent protein deacetylase hst2-1 [Diplonema papillatum]|nr:NAD-dependent protein deacetylase hst2-1 [Diplonema papillatum]|eukprot:gene8629-13344_t
MIAYGFQWLESVRRWLFQVDAEAAMKVCTLRDDPRALPYLTDGEAKVLFVKAVKDWCPTTVAHLLKRYPRVQPSPDALVRALSTCGDIAILRLLLRERPSWVFESRTDTGWSLLWALAAEGNRSGFSLLASQGMGMISDSLNVLHVAASRGHHHIVRAALESATASASVRKERPDPSNCAVDYNPVPGGVTDTTWFDVAAQTKELATTPTPGLEAGIAARKKLLECQNHAGERPLHVAAKRGHAGVVEVLLEYGADVEVRDASGGCPIHGATFVGEACLRLVLRAGARFSSKKDRMTAMHVAAARGNAHAIAMLASAQPAGFDANVQDAFGQTALHIACSSLQVEVVRALLHIHVDAGAKDHDGVTPAQAVLKKICSRSLQQQSGTPRAQPSASETKATETILHLLSDTFPLTDNAGATILHIAACISGSEGLHVLKNLLRYPTAKQVVTHEDSFGWTALHIASNRQHHAIFDELSAAAGSTYMQTFQRDKPRKKATFIPSQIARVPESQRKAVLPQGADLKGIAAKLRGIEETVGKAGGAAGTVVVLCGAGISVKAGIPDYRSEKGVYRTGDAKSAREYFSHDGLLADPEGFYKLARELFSSKHPTLAHRFMRALSEKGMLRRIYTQNIDDLECAVGVPRSKVVQCHGSFNSLICTNARCSSPPAETNPLTDTPPGNGVPYCSRCGFVLRPDVVFFGEPLPSAFNDRHADMEACELLIIMGTSLVVYPFASLPNEVSDLTPRLLLNNEPTGPWKGRSQSAVEYNYRDVFEQGDCDDTVRSLVRLLGWKDL